MCVWEREMWQRENPSLGSVNWLPNYTLGQMLSHPSFPKSRQGYWRAKERWVCVCDRFPSLKKFISHLLVFNVCVGTRCWSPVWTEMEWKAQCALAAAAKTSFYSTHLRHLWTSFCLFSLFHYFVWSTVSKEKHGPPLFTEKPQESITDESSLPWHSLLTAHSFCFCQENITNL